MITEYQLSLGCCCVFKFAVKLSKGDKAVHLEWDAHMPCLMAQNIEETLIYMYQLSFNL